MQEIWIPLTLITLFLFLHIIRPYIKKLRAIDGLAWLPILALLSIMALIPAYGFRPETLPLLLYSAVLTVMVIFKQINGDIKFRSFRKRKFIFVFFPLILLIAAAGTAFYFTPQKNLSLSTHGVHDLSINDYEIRIYMDENDSMPNKRPLLVLLPPAFGALAAMDETAGALRDRGFTVITCARNYGVNPMEGFRLIQAFIFGNVSAGANERGRALEEKRKEDAMFILSWIRQNPRLNGGANLFNIASRDAVFIGAYDAGGSALILLGDSAFKAGTREGAVPGRGSGGIKICGLVAIESPLWSLYQSEVNQIPDIPADSGWFQSVRYGIRRWLLEIKQKKITGLANIPELSIPVLFLVSDWSREQNFLSSRYEALLKCYASAQGQAFMISADGAGPLDYSDFPVLYPLVTTIFGGCLKSAWNAIESPGQSAAIITYFAESVLNAGGGELWPLRNTALPAGVQIEANGKRSEL